MKLQHIKRSVSCLGASLALILMLVSTMPVSAAGVGGSSGLSITPRKDYVINPGKTIHDKLSIGNLSSNLPLKVSLRMVDFTFTDQSGTPKLFLAKDAPQTAWSLKPFSTLPSSVTVRPGQTKTVPFSIKIPKNQGAGSYYSAILYQAGGNNSGQVALNASGVSLVFVSVPGIVHEDLQIQKLGGYASDDNGVTGKFVFIATSKPKMLGYTVKNNGNVAEAPAGSLTLKDIFGRKVKTVNKTNENSALALIGQTRLFTTCIQTVQQKIELEGGTSKDTSCTNPWLIPGRYSVSVDLFYGQNGNQTHEVTKTGSFWYLPWWFLIILALVIILIVVFITWLRRKIHKLLHGDKKPKKFKFKRR